MFVSVILAAAAAAVCPIDLCVGLCPVLDYMLDVLSVYWMWGVDPRDPPGRLLVVLFWTVYRSTHL